MNLEAYSMRDPTMETAAAQRARRPPPADLSRATVGLLSISKERSEEFLDTIEARLSARGLTLLRFAKPTHTKPAPEQVIQDIVERCDVVIEALAD
ncbi:MAG: hypothetical protein JNM79_01460 [Burkholderiales bacterium]|nr:hypothetical protein [Burkholderiales bacterium]